MPSIRFSIIAILPTNVRCKVKNSRHHNTLNTPLITNNVIVELGILCLDIHTDNIMPNVEYITVHTIGINISGIHRLGLYNVAYQSMTIFTNILPNIATIVILAIINIILINLLFFVSILLVYVVGEPNMYNYI